MALLLHGVKLGHEALRLRGVAFEHGLLELDRHHERVKHRAAELGLELQAVVAELRLCRVRHLQPLARALRRHQRGLHRLDHAEVRRARRRIEARVAERLVRAVQLLHRAFEVHAALGAAAAAFALSAARAAHGAVLGSRLEFTSVDRAVLVRVAALHETLGERGRKLVLRELAVAVRVVLHHAVDELLRVDRLARALALLALLSVAAAARPGALRREGAVLLRKGDGCERECEDRASERELHVDFLQAVRPVDRRAVRPRVKRADVSVIAARAGSSGDHGHAPQLPRSAERSAALVMPFPSMSPTPDAPHVESTSASIAAAESATASGRRGARTSGRRFSDDSPTILQGEPPSIVRRPIG